MKIIFYSTNSNHFDSSTFKIELLPTNETQFSIFQKVHPNDDFLCISQLPSMFMPEKSTIILPPQTTPKEFAAEIEKYSPDLVIALTFWVTPYDWLTINDALVAEELESKGIKTICNSVETGLICFDKYRTSQFLEKNHFNIAKNLFVDHDLYFCAGSQKQVIQNVYKSSVENQIRKLKLPLVIKDTVGLSSYGMAVANTYGEVMCYLNSKRNNSNRIVEEYIQGEHFGTEIYGTKGKYKILPPFKFTTNQYGITCPKLSEKFGPITNQDYNIEDLYKTLQKLAELLQINGVAQVDLIYADKKWYIIEINPRLSGMSYMYATSMTISVFEVMYRTCVENVDSKCSLPPVQPCRDVKLPLMSNDELQKEFSKEDVKFLCQTNDLSAKQEREKGFCECVKSISP